MQKRISNFLLSLLLTLVYSLVTGCTAMPQINQPYNLPWDRNWCWMVSTLHCLYRLDDFRKIVFQVPPQDPSKQETEAHKLARFLQQIFLLMEKKSQAKSQYHINDPQIFYESLFGSDLHKHLKSLPQIQKLEKHHKDFYLDYPDADKPPSKQNNPERYMGDVFNKAQSKSRKYQYFDDAITGLDLNKIENSNDPCALLWLIITALKGIPEIGALVKSTLVFLNNTNTNAIKPSQRVNIISFFAGEPTSKEACPPIIKTDTSTFKLLAIVMQKINSHATALVTYENKWFLYDSMQWKAHPHGEFLGCDLEMILDKSAQSAYYPYVLFYEKDQLTSQLSQVRIKLELLKEKLKRLKEALESLKISIAQNQ